MNQEIIIKLKTNRAWRAEFSRFARFLTVGASGTLVDFIILSCLKHFLGWATLPANIVSYSCGILNNYLLNRYWVYPEAKARQTLLQFFQFILVSLVGLGLNALLVLALEGPAGKILGNPGLGYIPAKIGATFIVLLWNFFANRFWTFSAAKSSGISFTPMEKIEKESSFYDQPAA